MVKSLSKKLRQLSKGFEKMPNNRPEKRYFSFHQLVIARLALLLQLLELRVHINLAAHDTLPTVRKNHTREALYRRGDALAHCKRPHTHTLQTFPKPPPFHPEVLAGRNCIVLLSFWISYSTIFLLKIFI